MTTPEPQPAGHTEWHHHDDGIDLPYEVRTVMVDGRAYDAVRIAPGKPITLYPSGSNTAIADVDTEDEITPALTAYQQDADRYRSVLLRVSANGWWLTVAHQHYTITRTAPAGPYTLHHVTAAELARVGDEYGTVLFAAESAKAHARLSPAQP
ncbi:hypothetical protein [Kitasatospora sp. NPDC057595]|uniref:hypothetical protein n=1 Tax=Kitasatospora sp. NPDC057595 TaxID=3346177 RepID=UPI0036C01E7E